MQEGQAPHALFDVKDNVGYMTIGTSHDTSEFVCDNIERIWEQYLQHRYTNTDTICLLCDGGGSNSSSHHIFKQSLIQLARRIEMNIIVCHYLRQKHIVFDDILPKWNYVVKYMAAE